MTRRQAIQRRLVLYLSAIVAMYLIVCWKLASGYLSPTRSVPGMPVGVREVRIPTDAGEDPAWVTPHFGKGRVLFVLAHGYGGSRGSWTREMVELDRRGYDCVAPAMPGQDASPDPTVGFGIKEAKVIADSVRWARSRYSNPPKVVLMGVSMGGAASWLASSLVPDVDAVVTEGAYARFDEAMQRFFDRFGAVGSLLLRPVIWIAERRSGIDPSGIVPLDAAAKWKGRPGLVIQAENDEIIPRSHAERLATSAGADYWLVPGATHACCAQAAEEEYFRRVSSVAERLK